MGMDAVLDAAARKNGGVLVDVDDYIQKVASSIDW